MPAFWFRQFLHLFLPATFPEHYFLEYFFELDHIVAIIYKYNQQKYNRDSAKNSVSF